MTRLFIIMHIVIFIQITPAFSEKVRFACATLGVKNNSSLFITGLYDVSGRDYTWIGGLKIGSKNNLYSEVKARNFSNYKGTAQRYNVNTSTAKEVFRLELRDNKSSSIVIVHPEGTVKQSLIQIDLKGSGNIPPFIEQYTEADCRFGDILKPVLEPLSETKELFKITSLKCPQNNSGILEQIQKSDTGLAIRIRYKIINGKAVKYIFEKARPGGSFEIIDVSDVTRLGDADNYSKTRYHIEKSETLLRDDCSTNTITWSN